MFKQSSVWRNKSVIEVLWKMLMWAANVLGGAHVLALCHVLHDHRLSSVWLLAGAMTFSINPSVCVLFEV